jgi:hypothetical protein
MKEHHFATAFGLRAWAAEHGTERHAGVVVMKKLGSTGAV